MSGKQSSTKQAARKSAALAAAAAANTTVSTDAPVVPTDVAVTDVPAATNVSEEVPVVAPENVPAVVAPEEVPVVTPDVPVPADVPSDEPVVPAAPVVFSFASSEARIRKWADKLYSNSALIQQINSLKAPLKDFARATEELEKGTLVERVEQDVVRGDKTVRALVEVERELTPEERTERQTLVAALQPQLSDIKAQINALSATRTRFSNEATAVLSVVCGEIVTSLLQHAMVKTDASNKKIVHVEQLFSEGLEQLPLYPLVKTLPLFKLTQARLSASRQAAETAHLLKVKLQQALSNFKKECGVSSKRVKTSTEPGDAAPQAVTPAQEPVVQDEEDENDPSRVGFSHYVNNIFRYLTQTNPAMAKIRISTDIKTFLSELLIQFIQRVMSLVLIMIVCMKNKTVSAEAVKKTIEMLLTDGHAHTETIELAKGQVLSHELVREAKAAAKADPSVPYDESKCYVEGYKASRRITFPTSAYVGLSTLIEARLQELEAEKNGNADTA